MAETIKHEICEKKVDKHGYANRLKMHEKDKKKET